MLALGLLHDDYDDVDEACRWYFAAACSDHPTSSPPAMLHLGLLHEELDRPAPARAWYRAAAVAGDTDTAIQARCLLKDLVVLDADRC